MATGALHLNPEVDEIGRSLHEQDENSQVTGVLVELHASALTLALHLLETGHYHTQKLDNDRCSDVGHDTQCEDRSLREGTTREHIEELHQTAVGEFLESVQGSWIDTWQNHIATKTVDEDEQESNTQSPAQVFNLPDVLYCLNEFHYVC